MRENLVRTNKELTKSLRIYQQQWKETNKVVTGLNNLAGPNMCACGKAFQEKVYDLSPSLARSQLIQIMSKQELNELLEV